MENVDALETLRLATADLIGFGIVGTLLDSAYDVLIELDPTMAQYLEGLNSQILDRFNAAETILFSIGENT